jgi:hypothetical protein
MPLEEQPGAKPGEHYGLIDPRTVYQPKTYSGELAGQGRWVDLGPLAHPVIRLFTDDHDRLGFLWLDSSLAAHDLAMELGRGLRSAAAQGRPTRETFDWWASRNTQALMAGPIQTGALADLA